MQLIHRRFFRLLVLCLCVAFAIQCAPLNQHIPPTEEEELRTDGVIARYHALLNTPFSHPFSGSGYIVGIEKSPRAKVGFTGKTYDEARLKVPNTARLTSGPDDLEQQIRTFEKATDDGKVMFVSHVIRYGQDQDIAKSDIDLLYSVYSETAFGKTPGAPEVSDGYEAGWAALGQLEKHVKADLRAAKTAGRPFTHILFLSMGWNNDQFESLERYNAIYQHSIRAAETDGKRFKPLVIGITWPSVWGGTSVVDVSNRVLHLGSYPVKALDADEIGYGIANHMLNAMLPRIEAESQLQTVLVGHSMGARILTRAYYSADQLKGAVPRPNGRAPIVIGLQGAFSINRFREDAKLLPPVRWVVSGEGGPYQDHTAPGGKMVLTWARKDRANPVARVATGAAHVGGRVGTRTLNRHPNLQTKFEETRIAGPDQIDNIAVPCAAIRDTGKVLYIDASEIIAAHSDIRNPSVGTLVWKLTDCLSNR